ncbi:excalibur calcium-binding domain-containing protein [Salipiger sp. IMCC34102]|uniref:excalibur calcium-binding domain-containing protein n=1 Tax=Salipiger sp. IMCC34102 TaxID=2510647 RepID=UPI00101DC4C9|nr:excalibur calcium-binding domain-containing protein [Salipiger sp. IMCC34102]
MVSRTKPSSFIGQPQLEWPRTISEKNMNFRALFVPALLGLAACGAQPQPGAMQSVALSTYDPNSPSGVGRVQFTRSVSNSRAVSNDRNCSDFATSSAAHQFFLNAGGPSSDPHDLDRDGDGYACEWGKDLLNRQAAERQRRAAAVTRPTPVRSASRCYTGPRGGTYTITSGGNKNYSGC